MKARQLRKETMISIAMALISLVALFSATYAWFIANNTVKATQSTISAKANNFVLQIATLEDGAQHGDNQSLVAVTDGHTISPSSTNDLKNWYVCMGWGQNGMVQSYIKPAVSEDGKYTIGSDRYAFIRSEYVLYTVTETGTCDVYLDGSEPGGAIKVSANGTPTSTVIPESMRVGITIQDLDSSGNPTGNEDLIVVYAPYNEIGKGNDQTGINGWTYVKDETQVAPVTYQHIYGTSYTYEGNNYAAVKNGESYEAPASNGMPIATDIGYNGVIMRVYIWLEGTDEQCVNNSNKDDPSTYDVTISLAGISK